ncbi:MAG: VWA domain-containing protein, partial [Armatimonadetes bacterium]|nr:VWA domain-containing protein [Armatimonadota bacterium]
MKKWPLFLAAAASAALLSPLRAQERRPDIFPPPIGWPRPIPLPAPLTELHLENQNAKIEVRGPLARTHLRQTLRNPLPRALEGSYLFALPRGAAVSNFAMTMGGQRLQAEILEGDKAREIYQGIVQKMRDPAILEFLDRDLVRAKIFPVPAHGTVEIELDYAQTLSENRLSLPLRAPGASRVSNARANVEISFADADVRAIYSPTHSVETRRAGGKTLISGEWSGAERDFSLLWTRGGGKVSLQMLTYRGDEADGTFLLLAAPDPAIAAAEIEAKDVVFVFDTSGSMEGAKIEQARRALRTLLGNLNPKDRFNIVTFASSVQNFRDGLVDATPANLDSARRFADGIKAVGGTNISDALQSALKMTAKNGRAQQIVFMTDGQPTVGQTSPDAIMREAQAANDAKARLFVFGVGNDVNARLLDALAQENRGASDYVLPSEDIETKVGALYEKIAFPVVNEAKIDFGGLGVYDVYPPQLPDLFRGAQVTVFGRFR